MKPKKQIINYIMIGLSVLAMTACGGSGSEGGSNSCLSGVNDSDGDGFHDGIDFAPNDASIPGDYSTQEKILSNPEVKKALKKAKENHDLNIRTELGSNPPNLTGYYRMESGGGRSIIFGQGHIENGASYYGSENKVCTSKEHFESFVSNFTPAIGYAGTYVQKNAMLRGSKKNFTYYEPFIQTCGSKTKTYAIRIFSASLNADGNIVDERGISVNVYRTGSPSRLCEVGVGGVAYYDSRNKITNLDELEYMCVDGKNAYTPGETWKNKDKESCRCTKDIEIECK